MESSGSRSRNPFFASTAVACFSYGALALVILHVVRPENAGHMVSDYAVGPYGWVMTSCFLALSCGCLMLLLGLLRHGPASLAARAGACLLGMVSAGLVVSAIFPTDVKRPITHSGQIHFISFLVNVAGIVLAAVLVSLGFGSHARWRPYQRRAVVLALLILLAFVLQFLTILWRWHYALANRFFILAVFAWMLMTSVRLRAITRDSPRE